MAGVGFAGCKQDRCCHFRFHFPDWEQSLPRSNILPARHCREPILPDFGRRQTAVLDSGNPQTTIAPDSGNRQAIAPGSGNHWATDPDSERRRSTALKDGDRKNSPHSAGTMDRKKGASATVHWWSSELPSFPRSGKTHLSPDLPQLDRLMYLAAERGKPLHRKPAANPAASSRSGSKIDYHPAGLCRNGDNISSLRLHNTTSSMGFSLFRWDKNRQPQELPGEKSASSRICFPLQPISCKDRRSAIKQRHILCCD